MSDDAFDVSFSLLFALQFWFTLYPIMTDRALSMHQAILVALLGRVSTNERLASESVCSVTKGKYMCRSIEHDRALSSDVVSCIGDADGNPAETSGITVGQGLRWVTDSPDRSAIPIMT